MALQAVMPPPPRSFQTDPQPFFQAGFQKVLEKRMQGLPILAPHIRVRVLPFRRVDDKWLGVAVTPWSVQALLAPAQAKNWKRIRPGVNVDETLPGGDFTFLAVMDSILGEYRMCSLKSPVSDFEDQAAAETFAKVCMDLMSTPQQDAEEPEEEGIALKPAVPAPREGAMSRRAFLTGREGEGS